MSNREQVKITFRNGIRNMDEILMTPTWNITVNQFDCGTNHENGNRESKISDGGDGRRLTVTPPEWIAPQGCRQYYFEDAGRLETFNFNEFQGK